MKQEILTISVWVGLLFFGSASACPATLLSVKPVRQSGPTCLVAATQTAISARERPFDQKQLTRQLPVFPDGIHAYDLVIELERRGWKTLAFRAPAEGAARLVEAGFGVVAMTTKAGGKHALAVIGSQRHSTQARCSQTLKSLYLFDPATGHSFWQSTQQFEAAQAAAQFLVFYRPGQDKQLASKRFPLGIAKRQHAKFMADTLFLRAKRHPKWNAQAQTLLQRALEFEPCLNPARTALIEAGNAPSSLPKCSRPNSK